jgi:uncharacterized protein (TIGR01777 family)
MRIFVMGGTGLVGSRLIQRLVARNDKVVLMTRRPDAAREKWGSQCTIVTGDPMQSGPWMDAVPDCEAVVNLVGENIFARRWRADFKELLRASRVNSTRHVAEAVKKNPRTPTGQPRVLVNASAIGYYGMHGDEELTESSPPGDDFLARLCVEWENATRPAIESGVRVALVRVGVVLDKEGGALKQMLRPFKMFVGGPAGSGKQYLSWIHHEDLIGILLLCLDNAQAAGPFNGTAPQPVTNRKFSNALGRALHRPSFMKTPRFMLRLALGEVANVITAGQRVLPKRAMELGYVFKFPEIDGALRDVLKETPAPV